MHLSELVTNLLIFSFVILAFVVLYINNRCGKKCKDMLFKYENGLSGLKLSTKVEHGERLHTVNYKGQIIPPEDTDYWTDDDFDKFNGETPYGNILDISIPKIKKRFHNINLTDDELKKLTTVIFQESKNIFIKGIRDFKEK
jgi:hypothetical protein